MPIEDGFQIHQARDVFLLVGVNRWIAVETYSSIWQYLMHLLYHQKSIRRRVYEVLCIIIL